MSSQTLVRRVESLEERVTLLEQLPARVDDLALQVVQLREEMHAEFSAIRTHIETGDERILSQERMLHEEVLARLALIQEAGPRRGKRR